MFSYHVSSSQALEIALKNSMPWLVLAGSGGLANLVSDIVENVQSDLMSAFGGAEEEERSPNMVLRDRITTKVKNHFPSEQDMDKLVDKVNVTLST